MNPFRWLACAVTGHRPQWDKPVGYPTHYPYPCKCGAWLAEHDPCDCERYLFTRELQNPETD